MRERRPYYSYIVEHSLALPASAIIALAWANLAPASYASVGFNGFPPLRTYCI